MGKEYQNKETGFPIALQPEGLPPLREGYVRVIHQTKDNHLESFIENGLIYNRKYAGRKNENFSNYSDIASMAVPCSEDSFWQRLTSDEVRHKGATKLAVFDMPAHEFQAHSLPEIAQHLNGIISRGYLVGYIPNYGTKDNETEQKLSVEEMAEKRNKALNNPLPPEYETPDWQTNIQKALDANIEHNKTQGDDFWASKLPDYSSQFPFAKKTNENFQTSEAVINTEQFAEPVANESSWEAWSDGESWGAWNDNGNWEDSDKPTNDTADRTAEIKECLKGEQANSSSGETDISTTSSSQQLIDKLRGVSDGKTPLPQASSKPQTMSKEKLQGLRYAPNKQDQR